MWYGLYSRPTVVSGRQLTFGSSNVTVFPTLHDVSFILKLACEQRSSSRSLHTSRDSGVRLFESSGAPTRTIALSLETARLSILSREARRASSLQYRHVR